MTVSSTLEAKLRGRPFSTAPAKAAAKALGIESFDDGAAYARFSNLVHWGYGTGWGVARGVLRALGVSPLLATPAHFIAIDVFHHLVYVTATGLAFELLDRNGSRSDV